MRSVRATSLGGSVSVSIDTNGAIQFNQFTLSNPPRMVIDLMGVRSSFRVRTINVNAPAVERVRVGQPSPGVVRVVLDSREGVAFAVTRFGSSLVIYAGGESKSINENLSAERPRTVTPPRSVAPVVSVPPGALREAGYFNADNPDERADNTKKNDGGDTRNKGDKSGKDNPADKGDGGGETDEDKRRPDQWRGKILPPDAKIVVSDRTLTGPNSAPQQRGNRIFLPVVTIGRVLGDTLRVNPIAKTVEVRRQTGVLSDFNAPLNQVREDGAVILAVSSTADIVFPPDPEALMLPIEIVSALLDVSVIVDETARVVKITRGQPQSQSMRAGAQHASWELYRADYQANLTVHQGGFDHNFNISSIGRIGDGRFTMMSNFDGGTGRDAFLMRRSAFTFDRPNGQRFIGGDFGTGTDLSFMSATVRGLWFQQPVGGFRMTTFAGRAMTGVIPQPLTPINPPINQPPEPRGFNSIHYDTSILGSYASFGPSINDPKRANVLLFSSGMMWFNGPISSGKLATGSVKYTSRRNQFAGDFGAGSFDGIGQDGLHVKGFAPMADITEYFNLNDKLSFHGHFTHIGTNFIDPQSSGYNVAKRVLAGGFGWRPLSWLGGSLNASSTTRLDSTRQNDRSITATISVTPRGPFPTVLFSHTQSKGTLLGGSSYTLVNATKEFDRWRLFGNLTRIRIGSAARDIFGPIPNPPSMSITAGAMVKIGTDHNLQVSQSIGSGGSLGGAVDWFTSSLFSRRISVGAGVGYNYSGGKLQLTERFLGSIQLARQQVFQFTWNQTPSGPQVLVQFRGPIIVNRKAEVTSTAALAEIRSYGAFYGKVYQDINMNGRYDPGVDQAQSGVQVRVDGSYFSVSDRNGDFRVENVKAGEHTVYLDLLSVRADLTLLDSPQQTAMLIPGRDSIVDFRLVRTGRIRGLVWLDGDGNGRLDDGEQLLPDVRVLTGSGRDTLTDAQGEFVLGDLPPGEHVVLVDEKTLPDGTKSANGSLRVIVKAASETNNVSIPVVRKPSEVNVRRFPPAAL
ncbi:MAG TPA: AMIN domain-containing protein [Blastocatellia bacterium]|nr:AMIN domain-containing protein [Blastocatellia bacterium]